MLTRERFELYESPKEHLLCIYAYDLSKETRDKIAALLLNDVPVTEIPETASGFEAQYDGEKDVKTMQKIEPDAPETQDVPVSDINAANVSTTDTADATDTAAVLNELPFTDAENSVSTDAPMEEVPSGPAMIDTDMDAGNKDYSNASAEEITADFNHASADMPMTEAVPDDSASIENPEIAALRNSNMDMLQATSEQDAAKQNAAWSDIVAWIAAHQYVQDANFMRNALLAGINVTFYPIFHQMIGDCSIDDYMNRAAYMINTAADDNIKTWYASGVACFRNQHLI
jgi:hypothetical protein